MTLGLHALWPARVMLSMLTRRSKTSAGGTEREVRIGASAGAGTFVWIPQSVGNADSKLALHSATEQVCTRQIFAAKVPLKHSFVRG